MVTDTQVKTRYKETDVGLIPEDWEIQNLSEHATLKARIGWQGLTTAEYLKSGSYHLITGTEFRNGRIDWDSCFYVDKERYDQDINIQVRSSDVLVTKDGTIGKVAYIEDLPKPATLNSGVFVIRPKNEAFHPKFFYYILKSKVFISFLKELSAGSTINHLYQRDFVNFRYQIPSSKEEQKAISNAIGDIDNFITKLDQLIEKKRNIKQGTMQELLTGKRRLPGFSGEWEKKRLDEIFNISAGRDLIKEDYSPIQDEKHKFPIFSNSLEDKGLYGYTKSPRYSKNCITITARGTLGKANARYYDFDAIGRLLILEPKKELSCFFLAEYLNNQVVFSIESTGVPQLTAPQASKYIVKYPSLKEQNAIAELLHDMDTEIAELESQKNKYLEIKQGMMQQLLTGRIRLI